MSFTTTGGVITTSTGYTEMMTESYEGITNVTLYAGNPLPTKANSTFIDNPNAILGGPASFDISSRLMPWYDFDNDGIYNDGIAIVTAYSQGLDDDNNQVIAWNYVPIVFSLSVNTFTVTTDKTEIHLGETAKLTVTIHDVNGNPVVGGSTIDITSEIGALSPKSIETSSPGKTTYYVYLTNDKDSQFDTPENAVVSVKLTSPNGNITLSSPPILLDVP